MVVQLAISLLPRDIIYNVCIEATLVRDVVCCQDERKRKVEEDAARKAAVDVSGLQTTTCSFLSLHVQQ